MSTACNGILRHVSIIGKLSRWATATTDFAMAIPKPVPFHFPCATKVRRELAEEVLPESERLYRRSRIMTWLSIRSVLTVTIPPLGHRFPGVLDQDVAEHANETCAVSTVTFPL